MPAGATARVAGVTSGKSIGSPCAAAATCWGVNGCATACAPQGVIGALGLWLYNVGSKLGPGWNARSPQLNLLCASLVVL